MVDAAEEALSFTKDKNRKEFSSDRMLVLSIIKEIEIIGEAASRISKDTKMNYSSIPWKDIIGMRNRLIHGYFDVDTDILWMTITTDIPNLLKQLKPLLHPQQNYSNNTGYQSKFTVKIYILFPNNPCCNCGC